MSEHIAPEERTEILVALAEMKGSVTQALTYIATHDARLAELDARLRAVENAQAQARGRTTTLAMIGGGAVSLVVALLVNTIGA